MRKEVRRTRPLARAPGIIMLTLGVTALTASIMATSTILAFIGLGLAFWGAILLYVMPEEHSRKALLEAALSPSLATISQVIQELAYEGDAIYLPPRYFADPETTKIYISNKKDTGLPTPEQIQKYEEQPRARNAQGILLTPPGIQLSKLLEKTLGARLIGTDLKNLQQKLPRLFVDNLEIAEDLEMQIEDGMTRDTTIRAKMVKPFYLDMFKETEEPSQLSGSIGSSICSAIAVALTKVTGKPVRIMAIKSSEEGNALEASYKIIED